MIHTVRGIGYMLDAPENALPPANAAPAELA
jgi:hypothetical protein